MKKLKNWAGRLSFQDLVPFIAFIVIFLYFTIRSYNGRTGNFRMLTGTNLTSLLEATMETILIACGTLFVVAQGSTDLSVGVNLGLSSVVGVWAATACGVDFLFIPVALLVGVAVGVFNGVIVSRFKVSSFMLTLAMLIGLRGLINYIQTFTGAQDLPAGLSFLQNSTVRIALFIVIIAVMAYVFQFTKAGRYSRAIGENENATKFVGVPVNRYKIIAFALSGLMSGVAAIFSVAKLGQTNQTMGQNLEIYVLMAILLGGVLVTGGSSAKFYKILLGSFSIQIIDRGLKLLQKGDVQTTESVEGALLLLILFLSAMAGRRKKKADVLPEAPAGDANAPAAPEQPKEN